MTKELEKVKVSIFKEANSAFLGSIVCSTNIFFDENVKTASTNGSHIKFNPTFFDSLNHQDRVFVLLHEIWHIARLHLVRRGNRDPNKWNLACDYVINNELIASGHPIGCTGGYHNLDWLGKSEEEIYELLEDDLDYESDLEEADIVGNIQTVLTAIHATKGCGNIPGDISEIVSAYLKPKVPWNRLLQNYLVNQKEEVFTWSRPNRRYEEYLPSRGVDETKLDIIYIYIDVSASITRETVEQFVTEVRWILDNLSPTELRVVQFDTNIRLERVISTLDDLEIIGRGGTSLHCVKEHLEASKPSLAIVFSDLECQPMSKPECNTDIIWIIEGNLGHKPNFGKCIYT